MCQVPTLKRGPLVRNSARNTSAAPFEHLIRPSATTGSTLFSLSAVPKKSERRRQKHDSSVGEDLLQGVTVTLARGFGIWICVSTTLGYRLSPSSKMGRCGDCPLLMVIRTI